MRPRKKLAIALTFFALLSAAPRPATAQQKGDFLTDAEADKIRDAERNLSLKIKLYVDFADDRLAKFKYTLAHPNEDRKRDEILNGLLNDYGSCIDAAADLIDVAKQHQQDIRPGLKSLQSKGKDFLAYLQELSKDGSELGTYKMNLDDAIEATQDAMDSAQKALKEIQAPVRRKQ